MIAALLVSAASASVVFIVAISIGMSRRRRARERVLAAHGLAPSASGLAAAGHLSGAPAALDHYLVGSGKQALLHTTLRVSLPGGAKEVWLVHAHSFDPRSVAATGAGLADVSQAFAAVSGHYRVLASQAEDATPLLHPRVLGLLLAVAPNELRVRAGVLELTLRGVISNPWQLERLLLLAWMSCRAMGVPLAPFAWHARPAERTPRAGSLLAALLVAWLLALILGPVSMLIPSLARLAAFACPEGTSVQVQQRTGQRGGSAHDEALCVAGDGGAAESTPIVIAIGAMAFGTVLALGAIAGELRAAVGRSRARRELGALCDLGVEPALSARAARTR